MRLLRRLRAAGLPQPQFPKPVPVPPPLTASASEPGGSLDFVPNDSIPPSNYDLERLFPRRYLDTKVSDAASLDWRGLAWDMASKTVCLSVALSAKIFMSFNKVQVHNVSALTTALDRTRTPLLTVSNHHSCLDDPLLLLGALLPWRHVFSPGLHRWSLAAHDVCFSSPWHGAAFALGRIVPVVRGRGVRQEGVGLCKRRLEGDGGWVHVFPEGKVIETISNAAVATAEARTLRKVNLSKSRMRLKWGVGHLVSEVPTATVLPLFHLGMDGVQPNHAQGESPFVPRPAGKRVTVCVGEPIKGLKDIVQGESDDVKRRKAVTDVIQVELRKLEEKTQFLHHQRTD